MIKKKSQRFIVVD